MVDESQPDKPRSKTGGRVKGQVNKKNKPLLTAVEICQQMGFDPLVGLIRVANNLDIVTGDPYIRRVLVGKGESMKIEELPGYEDETRVSALREVTTYVHPKKKAIEHTGGDGKPLVPPDIHIHFV